MTRRIKRKLSVINITTEMLRKYLVEYQAINNCGKVTIDNIYRSLSTFLWLEEENYILNQGQIIIAHCLFFLNKPHRKYIS